MSVSAARRRLAFAAWLLGCGALAACSPPTIADACRNVCACDRGCGPTDADGLQATCEESASAGREKAAAEGCATEYDALLACVYTASCEELSDGCSATTDVLLRCEAIWQR